MAESSERRDADSYSAAHSAQQTRHRPPPPPPAPTAVPGTPVSPHFPSHLPAHLPVSGTTHAFKAEVAVGHCSQVSRRSRLLLLFFLPVFFLPLFFLPHTVPEAHPSRLAISISTLTLSTYPDDGDGEGGGREEEGRTDFDFRCPCGMRVLRELGVKRGGREWRWWEGAGEDCRLAKCAWVGWREMLRMRVDCGVEGERLRAREFPSSRFMAAVLAERVRELGKTLR